MLADYSIQLEQHNWKPVLQKNVERKGLYFFYYHSNIITNTYFTENILNVYFVLLVASSSNKDNVTVEKNTKQVQ